MYAIHVKEINGEWEYVGGKYGLPMLFHTYTAAWKEAQKEKYKNKYKSVRKVQLELGC